MSIRPLPIVATKLSPPKLAGASLRPDTLSLIQRGGQRRLLVVQAPAGYGKTTAVAEAARVLNWRVAWYKLDILDQDPVVFAASLVEAVRLVLSNFGTVLQSRLADAHDAPLDASELLGILAAEFNNEVDGDLHLVLDDYHETANSPDLNTALDYLLASTPSNVHTVVLSRYEPSFRLSRYRLAQDLIVLEGEHLRFTPDQVQAYLAARGLRDLHPTHLDYVLTMTEGWPAGVALVADALAASGQRVDEAVLADPFLKGDLYTYLAEQVYAIQDAGTQSFLRQSAALEHMTPELAEAVTCCPKAGKTLERLATQCLFTFRTEANHYRYHRLFREYLKHKALQEDGIRSFQEAQLRAAHALEEAGDFSAATEMFFLSNEPLRGIKCAVHAGADKWDDYSNAMITSWLGRQTDRAASRDPHRLLLISHMELRQAHLYEALDKAHEALRAFESCDDLYGQYLAASALESIYFWRGEYHKAICYSRRALQLSSTPSQRVHALSSLASAKLHFAAWDEAESAWDTAVSLLEPRVSPQSLRIACARVHSWFLQGRVNTAAAHMDILLPEIRSTASPSLLASFLNVAASVALHRGDYLAAMSLSSECLDIAARFGMRHIYPYGQEVQGQIHCAVGDFSSGQDMMRQAIASSVLRDDLFSMIVSLSHIGTSYRRLGDHEQAIYFYQKALRLSDYSSTLYPRLLVMINLTFTDGIINREARNQQLQRLRTLATSVKISSLAKRCEFCDCILKSIASVPFADTQLLRSLTDHIEIGHLHYLSQELSIHMPYVSHVLSSHSSHNMVKSVIGILSTHHSADSSLNILLGKGACIAQTVLEICAETMDIYKYRALVESAKKHHDPRVRSVARRISQGTSSAQDFPELTPREREVLSFMARGYKNAAIAEQMVISMASVKTYINRIFFKLGVNDRVSAVLIYKARTEVTRSHESIDED